MQASLGPSNIPQVTRQRLTLAHTDPYFPAMISANNLKRSRDCTSPSHDDHKQLNITAQPLASVEVHHVPRIVANPCAKKTRTGLSTANGSDGDVILIVQHIVCIPCDQLYTLQGDMDPQRECVSVTKALVGSR